MKRTSCSIGTEEIGPWDDDLLMNSKTSRLRGVQLDEDNRMRVVVLDSPPVPKHGLEILAFKRRKKSRTRLGSMNEILKEQFDACRSKLLVESSRVQEQDLTATSLIPKTEEVHFTIEDQWESQNNEISSVTQASHELSDSRLGPKLWDDSPFQPPEQEDRRRPELLSLFSLTATPYRFADDNDVSTKRLLGL